MVLEILTKPSEAVLHPWRMIFIGGIYALFAAGLSYWIFEAHASLIMVAFAAIAAIPFIHKALDSEEKKNVVGGLHGLSLLKEHKYLVSMLTYLFLGYVAVFLLLFLALPSSIMENLFRTQVDTLTSIRSATPTGNFFSFGSFIVIMLNNMKILLFCVVFSVFYGMGAIFILSWNATVMAAAMGTSIREGVQAGTSYLLTIPINLIGYLGHGIPEIIAYFIGGVAGGIMSVALMKEKFRSTRFNTVFQDSINLVVVAIAILAVAGIIEVGLSPLILR